jgi:hypothetical protein
VSLLGRYLEVRLLWFWQHSDLQYAFGTQSLEILKFAIISLIQSYFQDICSLVVPSSHSTETLMNMAVIYIYVRLASQILSYLCISPEEDMTKKISKHTALA